jgi:hypothetical protein
VLGIIDLITHGCYINAKEGKITKQTKYAKLYKTIKEEKPQYRLDFEKIYPVLWSSNN